MLDMPSVKAQYAGMQYTVRNVPPEVDRRLRAVAAERGQSLNEVVLRTLAQGVGLDPDSPPRRDLSGFAGSWVEDPAVDAALEAQREIDPELWR